MLILYYILYLLLAELEVFILIKMNDITRDGNPVLRKRAEKLTFPLDPKYLKVADEMMEYLKNSQDPAIAEKYHLRAGVGLAAPQIGLSIQMASVLVPGPDNTIDLEETLVNPVIVSQSNCCFGGRRRLSFGR